MNCIDNESKIENLQEIGPINGCSQQSSQNDPPVTIKTEAVHDLLDIKPAVVKEEIDDPETSNFTSLSTLLDIKLPLGIKSEIDDESIPESDIKLELVEEINEPSVSRHTCNVCNMSFINWQLKKMHLNLYHAKVSLPNQTDYTVKYKNYKPNRKRFSVATMKKLIECVRNNPCLYDTENDEFNNKELKALTWMNIASECNLSNGVVAKAEWKNLKTRLIQAIVVNDGTNSSATRTQKQWQYKRQMEFLLPYLTDDDIHSVPRTEQIPATVLQEPLEINEENADYYPHRTTTSKQKAPSLKRKRQKSVEASTSSDTQPLDMFFLSMCATTKNLPPYVQLQVKKKIFQAVIEAEEIVAAMHNDQAKNNIFHGNTSTQDYDNNLSPFSIESNLEEDWQGD